MSPRWQKIIRDLLRNKSRTLLVVLTIAVGVFAFGSVFITREGLLTNLSRQYSQARDASITLFINDFGQDLVNWVKTQPRVEEAQGRTVYTVKLKSPKRDFDLDLYAFSDYDKMLLGIPQTQKGQWPPQKGEVVLERATASYTGTKLFDKLLIELPSGRRHELTLSGLVYAPTAPPPNFSGMLTSYVTLSTLRLLNLSDYFNRLEIRPTPEIKTQAQAEDLASKLSEKLKDKGIEVKGSMVFKPNVSPGQDPSNAFTAILAFIGSFSLILSAFLVINTISAVMSQQRQQIGIMKAIGATRKQIITLYLVMVAFYGFLSLFIALPMGMVLGYAFLKIVTGFLNISIVSFVLPPWVLAAQVGAALFIPIVSALYPILSGAKIPIRESLTGVENYRPDKLTEKILSKISFLSRPLLLSLRNTFRKKGRLFLTLGTLVVSGMLFISVLNVRQAMRIELDRLLALFDFGVSFSLAKNYDLQPILKRAGQIEGVKAVEGRISAAGQIIHDDQSKGTSFSVIGLPFDSAFVKPTLTEGRWLQPDDKQNIVISSAVLRDEPNLKVGDNFTVEIKDEKYVFGIVGIIATAGDQKMIYANFPYLSQLLDKPNQASVLLVKTEPNDAQTQDKVAKAAEDSLKRAGFQLSGSEKRHVMESSISASFDFLVMFLLIMAVMIALVGGLGLAGTMSLNVMERTREIGVMRSVGATNSAIRRIFIVEAFIIAILSWILSLPLSLLMTKLFCIVIGQAFFARVLLFTFVPYGIFLWLLIILLIALVSSFLPARSAGRMSIKDTLSYE